MSFYGFAIMGCLFAADMIYTYVLDNEGFLRMGKRNGVLYAVPRLFVLIMLPYWAGTYLMGENNNLIVQIIICLALSATLISLEFYFQKRSGDLPNCLYFPALLMVSIIVLLFLNHYDYEHTVINRLVYSLSGLALALVSSLTYSAIKSKVSDFRYGTALTLTALATSSLIFGVVTGTVIRTCLG